MSLDLDKYREACASCAVEWEATDEILYALCQRYPGHQDRGGINAKLLILDRADATGIERQITSKRTQGSSLEQLSELLWRHRDDVDAAQAKLRTLREPLTREKLNTILDAHGQLVGIVQRVVRKGQTPRSFVSKYLHFHNPAVPIYNSVAVRIAQKYYRRERGGSSVQIPATADPQYADFLMRFGRLYQEGCESRTPDIVSRTSRFSGFFGNP